MSKLGRFGVKGNGGGVRWWWLAAATCGLLAGCAHRRPVPNELTEARTIFARASAGPARRHATARLAEAQAALNAAEQAYLSGSPIEAEDRAYVATRRSELAEAEASTVLAVQRRTGALQELATLTGTHADRARAELAAAGHKESPNDVARPVAAASAPMSVPATTAQAADPSSPTTTPGLQPARTQEPAPAAALPTDRPISNPGLVPARAVESQPAPTSVTPSNAGSPGGPGSLVPPPVTVPAPDPRPATVTQPR